MPLQLSHLNADILAEILSYLYERDALRLALTGKHLHGYAIRRVAAVVSCFIFDELRGWHTYLSNNHARAADVRGFTAGHGVYPTTIYGRDRYQAGIPSQSEVEDCIADILSLTHNVRHVHIGQLVLYHRVLSTLPRLAQLSKLQLWNVTDQACPYLEQLPAGITHLLLQCNIQFPPTIRQVVRVLRHCATAQVVHIQDLCPPAAMPIRLPDLLRLDAVRRLCLTGCTVYALDLITLFPYLRMLTLYVDPPKVHQTRNGDVELPPAPHNVGKFAIAPLRRLNWPASEPLPLLSSALMPVHHLHLFGGACDRNPGASMDVIGQASPVVLSVSTIAEGYSYGGALWEFIANSAPRLRVLDLAQDKHIRNGHELAVWLVRPISLACFQY